ncbi:zinc transporter ZntB [Paremcibacter congregatus]|uniref:Zinc transporter ZntB n=1 Tax=Paremcibacter congregatus TaxID=2043170 RepID=A0A2G4YMK0_9PROT|nr:zinc transporter ZntB [Paremcibacter congregatus]PHZ83554.1 zinc transporter ZntB [Paremcibacter congregatus]QDE28360.1 zinc transporter ZntB [Paremcibacter congregatus]
MTPSGKSDPILMAYEFDGVGGGRALIENEVGAALKDKHLAWVHLDMKKEGTKPWLEKEISYLDPHIVNALLADETRPRVTEIGDGALIILRGVNLNENADPEDMVSIRLWIDKERIISLQRRPLKAVADMAEKIIQGKGPENAGEFVSQLVSRLFERMEPALLSLDDMTDRVEEEILEGPDVSLRETIINIRKRAIIFRRYMAPQKDAIGHFRLCNFDWLDAKDKRHLQESQDRVMRYVEDLDAIRERAQIVKDELANMIADRLNKNMYILSVIAAIFLPLGFFTGLLGINVGGIPGADNADAFWIFCGLLVSIVALQVWLFKKLKWF